MVKHPFRLMVMCVHAPLRVETSDVWITPAGGGRQTAREVEEDAGLMHFAQTLIHCQRVAVPAKAAPHFRMPEVVSVHPPIQRANLCKQRLREIRNVFGDGSFTLACHFLSFWLSHTTKYDSPVLSLPCFFKSISLKDEEISKVE